jgi:hypothetical protein
MSTVKANAIIDASGGNTATINSMTPTADSLQGFRNRIINGDMRIDQRNAGASVATSSGSSAYVVDRWAVYYDATSKLTAQQNAGSVTPPSGYSKYLGVTSSSAYTVGAGERFALLQSIEGFNMADLNWGTANAKTITISFWVRSSLTGTFGGALRNGNTGNPSYPFTYTISAANTWEYETITIAGPTTGTWDSTNGSGIQVWISLGTGSTYSGTAGSWAATTYFSATGATSVVGTNGATFYITGVQLEVGSVATPFERRDYGREMILCQRYFWKTFAPSTAPAQNVSASNVVFVGGVNNDANTKVGSYPCPVQMRADPTVVTFNPFAANANWRVPASTTDVTPTLTPNTQSIQFSLASATNSCAHGHLTASAEL